MRKILLLTLFAAALYTSCKKDPTKGLLYYVFADKNDNTSFKSIETNAGFKSLTGKDTLYIGAHYGEDNLTIRLIYNGVGAYQSTSLDAIFITTLGQDAVVRTYHLTNDPANIVNITNIDQAIVEGTFDLTFKEIQGR